MKQSKSGGITKTVIVSGFPFSSFKSWEEDCKQRFGDCRWVKMIHDHQVSNMLPIINTLMLKIEELEKNIEDLRSQDKEKPNEVLTLGGEVK